MSLAVKKTSAFVALLLVGLLLAVPIKASAATRPYFQVQNGDVFAGGWFSTSTTSCVANQAPYQSPTHKSDLTIDDSTKGKGGIFAYGKNSGSNVSGSKADFGAFALGLIEGKDNPSGTDEPYGFGTGGKKTDLTFANSINLGNPPQQYVTTNLWGGIFEGATPQAHCIPDYFTTKQNSPDTTTIGSQLSNFSTLASPKQYLVNGDLTINSTNPVAVGQNLTVFVKGNVYISKDITYAGGYNNTNVPRFSLVVLGSIYIDPGVTQLNGLYVAQPDTSKPQVETADTGVIWTCHGPNAGTIPSSSDIAACNKPLVFNGAVVAKQVNLLRSAGDVSNGTVAETFNFNPEAVIGGPFFDDSGAVGSIDSIVSLPPIF